MRHALSGDEVAKKVWRVTTPCDRRNVNVYLIDIGDGFVLFDAGVKATADSVRQIFEQWHFPLSEIKTIVVSHSHHDHIGALAELAEASGATVIAHKLAEAWMLDHERQFLERFGRYKKDLPVPKSVRAAFFEQLGRPWLAEHWLDRLPVSLPCPRKVQLLHTPGHSPDCISLWLPDDRVLLSGDAFAGAGVARHLPYYTDLEKYRKTLSVIAEINPQLLLTAHFAPISGETIPQAIQQSSRFTELLDEFVLHALRNADAGLQLHFLTEMVCARFGRILSPDAATTIFAHLQSAAQKKQVFEENAIWRMGNKQHTELPILPHFSKSLS